MPLIVPRIRIGKKDDLQNCPYCSAGFTMSGILTSVAPIGFKPTIHTFEFLKQHINEGLSISSINTNDDRINDNLDKFEVIAFDCHHCDELTIWLHVCKLTREGHTAQVFKKTCKFILMIPKFNITKIPTNTPDFIAEDYKNAHKLLDVYHNASAAMSRRCLQAILRHEYEIPKNIENNFFKEIKYVIEQNDLSSTLLGVLDHIRKIGNIGAHPDKIISVSYEDAEICLTILSDLLDEFYVKRFRYKSIIE